MDTNKMLNNEVEDEYDLEVEGSGDINYIQRDNAIVKITINNKNGTTGNIYITEHCNPNVLATSFVNKHQLSKSVIPKLEAQIIERVNIALEEKDESAEDEELVEQEEEKQQIIYRNNIIQLQQQQEQQQQQQQQHQNYIQQEKQNKVQLISNDTDYVNINDFEDIFNQSSSRPHINSINKSNKLSINSSANCPSQLIIETKNRDEDQHINQKNEVEVVSPVDNVWDRFDRTNSRTNNKEVKRSHSAEPISRRTNSYSNIFDRLYHQTTELQNKRNELNNKIRDEYNDIVNNTKFTTSIGHKTYSPSNFVKSSLHVRSTSPSPFSRRNSLLKEEHNDGILNRQPNRRSSSAGRIRDGKANYIFDKNNNLDESKASSNNTRNNVTIHDRLYAYAFEKKTIQLQKNNEVNKERNEWIQKNKFENSIGHLPYSPHHKFVGKDHNMLYNYFHKNKEVKRRASIKVSEEQQFKIDSTSFIINSPSKSSAKSKAVMVDCSNIGEKLYAEGKNFREKVDKNIEVLKQKLMKEKEEKEEREIMENHRVYFKKGAENMSFKDFPLHAPILHTSPLKQRRASVTTEEIFQNQYEYSTLYKEKMDIRKKNIEKDYNKMHNNGIPVIAKKSHSISKLYREDRSDDNGSLGSRSRCFSPSTRSKQGSRENSRERGINRSSSRERYSNNNNNSTPMVDNTNNRLTVDSTPSTTKDIVATDVDVSDSKKIEVVESIVNNTVESNNDVKTASNNIESKYNGSKYKGRRLYPNSGSELPFKSSVNQATISSQIRQNETIDHRMESKILIGKVDALSLEVTEIMSNNQIKNVKKSKTKGEKLYVKNDAEVSISPIQPQSNRTIMASPSNNEKNDNINTLHIDENNVSPFQLPLASPIMIPVSPGSFSYDAHRNNITSVTKSYKPSNNMKYTAFSPLGKSVAPSPISNLSNLSSATTRSSVSLYDQLYDDRLRNAECKSNAIKKHNIEPSFKPDIGLNNVKVEENRDDFYKRLHDHKVIQDQEINEQRNVLHYEIMRQELSPANGSSSNPISPTNRRKNNDITNNISSNIILSPKATSIVSNENINKSKLSSILASDLKCSKEHIQEVLHRLTVVEANRMKDEVANKRKQINKEIFDNAHINQTLCKSNNMVQKIRIKAISEIYDILVQFAVGKVGTPEIDDNNVSINSSIVMDGDSLNGSIDNVKENNDDNCSHILLDTTLASSNLIQPKNLATFVEILLSRCQSPNHLLTKEDFISKFEQLILTGDAPPVNSFLVTNNQRRSRLEKVEHGYNNGLTTEEREIKICTWNPIIPNKSIEIAIHNKKNRNKDQSHGDFLWSYEDKRQTRLEIKRKELEQKEQKECTFQPYLFTKSSSFNTTARK